jgi:hypothetical protein
MTAKSRESTSVRGIKRVSQTPEAQPSMRLLLSEAIDGVTDPGLRRDFFTSDTIFQLRHRKPWRPSRSSALVRKIIEVDNLFISLPTAFEAVAATPVLWLGEGREGDVLRYSFTCGKELRNCYRIQ